MHSRNGKSVHTPTIDSCLKLVALLGCATVGAMAYATPATLYERLGGEKAIVQFVDETINLTSSDPRTSRTFEKVNLRKLKQKISTHICKLADGPCTYDGDPMNLVHQGMDITEAEFYGMVEHLRIALGRAGVGEGAKNELLRILAPMKREIVTR